MFCITSVSFSHPSKACFVRTSILPKVPFTMRGRKKAQTISFLFMLSSFHRTKSSFHLGFLFLKFISHGKKKYQVIRRLWEILVKVVKNSVAGFLFVHIYDCFWVYYYYYYYFVRRSARTGTVAFRTYVWALSLFLPPSLPHCLPHFRSSGSLLVSDVNGDLFLSLSVL